MKLQEGKRYVTRSGRVTGPIKLGAGDYPFRSKINGIAMSWATNGSAYLGTEDVDDLVSEYAEKEKPEVKPEDLRGYSDLEKERRDFWASTIPAILYVMGKNSTLGEILVRADNLLEEFDKRFNK